MKITVRISSSDLKEICFFTGQSKKGTAIRKMVTDALMLKRRQLQGQKFISGQWSAELAGLEGAKEADYA